MTDDDEHSTHPSPPPSRHETQPAGAPDSSMLPGVNPDDAPDIVLHIPPNTVPSIREAETLAPKDSVDHTHVPTNGDFETMFRNVIRDHEKEEKKAAKLLADKVVEVEREAQRERKELADKLEHVSNIVENLADLHQAWPGLVKEAAASVADTFLGRIDTLISEFAGMKNTLMEHGLKIEKNKGDIADVKQRLVGAEERIEQLERALVGDGR